MIPNPNGSYTTISFQLKHRRITIPNKPTLIELLGRDIFFHEYGIKIPCTTEIAAEELYERLVSFFGPAKIFDA